MVLRLYAQSRAPLTPRPAWLGRVWVDVGRGGERGPAGKEERRVAGELIKAGQAPLRGLLGCQISGTSDCHILSVLPCT